MKKDKEEHILSSLQKERFNDLLKLYSSIQKKVYVLLSKDETTVRDIEDIIKNYIEVGNLVDAQVNKRIIRLQREKMYEYTKKK